MSAGKSGGGDLVGSSNVVLESGSGRLETEAVAAVVESCIVSQDELSRLAVVNEAVHGVEESNRIGHNVVGGWAGTGVSSAELESVSVTCKTGEAPSEDLLGVNRGWKLVFTCCSRYPK